MTVRRLGRLAPLHAQIDPRAHCRQARRATVVAVGLITRSVSRIETSLERLRQPEGAPLPVDGTSEGDL